MTSLRTVLLASLTVLLLGAALPQFASADETAADQPKPAAATCPGAGANGATCCTSCQENAAKLAAAGEKDAADAPAHECPCQRARRLREEAAKKAQ